MLLDFMFDSLFDDCLYNNIVCLFISIKWSEVYMDKNSINVEWFLF